jgi:hypothetical protein
MVQQTTYVTPKSYTVHSKLKQQMFTVPGGITTTEGIGTIILHLQNFHTGNVDQLVLNKVAYMPLS